MSRVARKRAERPGAVGAEEQCQLYHTPVSCIVDYKGFRVLATAVLPIDGANTLVLSAHEPGEQASHQLDELTSIAAELNLKEQRMILQMGSSKTVTLGDVQVHKGLDGRCYIVDTQTLMPSDLPRAGTNDSIVRQLRPELVRAFAAPLFSQAYLVHTGGDLLTRLQQQVFQIIVADSWCA